MKYEAAGKKGLVPQLAVGIATNDVLAWTSSTLWYELLETYSEMCKFFGMKEEYGTC
jgi:hypothetical protein